MRMVRLAKMTIRIMFCAMPGRDISGFKRKVTPSMMRKKAMMRRFRMMISMVPVSFSAFLMARSNLVELW